MKNVLLLILAISALNICIVAQNPSQEKAGVPEDYCLNDEELQLFNLLNDLRKSRGLPALQLSKSLSYTAYQHVRDLYINRPDTSGCNMHSWSDKGNWTPVCFPREQGKKKNVCDKPKELTMYPGQAHEILYWVNGTALPEEIFDQWRNTNQSSSLILNTGKWLKTNWKNMGISIYKGYSSMWLGEAIDPDTELKLCHSDSVISSKKIKTVAKGIIRAEAGNKTDKLHYYLIFGSFPTFGQAREAQQTLQEEGFENSKILENQGKFRVSLADFDTQDAVRQARKQLDKKYKEAWIYKE
jgi:hypothetical protein